MYKICPHYHFFIHLFLFCIQILSDKYFCQQQIIWLILCPVFYKLLPLDVLHNNYLCNCLKYWDFLYSSRDSYVISISFNCLKSSAWDFLTFIWRSIWKCSSTHKIISFVTVRPVWFSQCILIPLLIIRLNRDRYLWDFQNGTICLQFSLGKIVQVPWWIGFAKVNSFELENFNDGWLILLVHSCIPEQARNSSLLTKTPFSWIVESFNIFLSQ